MGPSAHTMTSSSVNSEGVAVGDGDGNVKAHENDNQVIFDSEEFEDMGCFGGGKRGVDSSSLRNAGLLPLRVASVPSDATTCATISSTSIGASSSSSAASSMSQADLSVDLGVGASASLTPKSATHVETTPPPPASQLSSLSSSSSFNSGRSVFGDAGAGGDAFLTVLSSPPPATSGSLTSPLLAAQHLGPLAKKTQQPQSTDNSIAEEVPSSNTDA